MAISDPQIPAEETGGKFFLRLLGSPSLEAADQRSLPGLGPGKSLALLAYLSVRGPARRDELIGILWGEITEEKARNAFRQSLHRLRAVVGDTILPQDREHVAIRGDGMLRSDRDAFIEAVEARRWEAAIQNYNGEFLEGLDVGEPAFDRWADAERVGLRARFEEALLAAGQSAVADGRVDDAVRYAQRLTATAPFDEHAALFEANTLVTAGRPNQAVAALNAFASRLQEGLDLSLPPAVRALLERLERRTVRDTPPSGTTERGRLVASFVGRSAELSRMLALVSGLRAERGATLLVEGEAGVGKSRLLDEFSERARNLGGTTLLRGREAGLGGGLPYAGIADALRPIVRAPGVAGASKHLLAEAARLLPELRDAFELPPIAPIEDETGRLRFFEGMAALIDAAAYERPVILIIDDAHHASPSTLDLLGYLTRRLQQSPVLIVVAFRSDRDGSALSERLRELDGSADSEATLVVSPLDGADARQLARELLRGVGASSEELVERIARASNGRPFAIADLARQAAGGDLPSEVPMTLRDALFARFHSASPSQRRIFFAASLFERSAPLRLLAAAAHLPEPTAFDAVEHLVRVGLLRATDHGYVVAHDCTLGFLVEASGLAGRALLAGWAADALAGETDFTESELAALYAMAGRGGDAFRHARAAAFAAAAVGAATEVTRLLGIALTFAPNDAARREIDSLLTAFGRTRLVLPASTIIEPATPSRADAMAEPRHTTAPPDEQPVGSPSPSTRSAPRWNVGTRRQWAVSIAVSLLVVLGGFAASRAIAARTAPPSLADTLVLAERDARGAVTTRVVLGAWQDTRSIPLAVNAGLLTPAWVDSLRRPFASPRVSPDQRYVAVRRVTPRGADLIVISADRRDTIPIATNGDFAAFGWSPDSRALLVSRARTAADGSYVSDLLVAWLAAPGSQIAIDTSTRSVADAEWSPDGSRIAWVARSATTRLRDVFVSRADGSDARNISANPADDYDISWSPDGSLLAYTSTRGGGTRLYVHDLEADRLWPISDRPSEAHPVFSPDGRSIAFESTRDGDLAIYARPSLGGTVRRITPPSRQFSIDEWRGATSRFVDRVRIVGSSSLAVGDTVRLGVIGVTSQNRAVSFIQPRWSLLDNGVVTAANVRANDSSSFHIVGRGIGTARVVAEIPGWRADTLILAVNTREAVHVEDGFSTQALDGRWIPLGAPSPYVAKAALFPNGDLEWESGVLLRSPVELRAGLRLRARVHAPFGGRASPAVLTIGFVPSTPESAIDRQAPRFPTLLTIQWDGASGNLVYAAGQQTFSEAAPEGDSHAIEIVVGADQSVSFIVDASVRWKSSLTFLGDVRGTPAQVWIGGRATGSGVSLSNFALDLPPRR